MDKHINLSDESEEDVALNIAILEWLLKLSPEDFDKALKELRKLAEN